MQKQKKLALVFVYGGKVAQRALHGDLRAQCGYLPVHLRKVDVKKRGAILEYVDPDSERLVFLAELACRYVVSHL